MTSVTGHLARTGLLAVGTLAAALATPVAAQARPAVIELFTSQGCSSCPPADALLNTLADRDDVIALTYNITYWDYLGWRDTLGREEHTARQEAYAQHFRDRKYTPQLVIDGESHLPGSRTKAATRAIDTQIEKVSTAPALATVLSATGATITHSAASNTAKTATVWMVQYDTAHEVEITRGENAGETITYSNVVRDITLLHTWDMTQPLSLDVARDSLTKGNHDGCAIIIQQDTKYGVGPVIAAARLDMDLLN